MSWEAWIENNIVFNDFDDLLDFIVEKFSIDKIGRTYPEVDMKQFIALWWFKHKYQFKKCNTNVLIGKKLGFSDHSTITYLTNYRVPTKDYEKNTQPLVEAIEKHYICI